MEGTRARSLHLAMEPNVEGVGGDHTATNTFPFHAKSHDDSGGAPNPSPLQHPACNQDLDGPQDHEPDSQGSPTKSMHYIKMEMDI